MSKRITNAKKTFDSLSAEKKRKFIDYFEKKDVEKDLETCTPEEREALREALRAQISGKGGKSRKRKAKEPKDPNAPKGVKKAYFFFAKAKLPEIKAEDDNLSHPEAMKKCGEAWKKATEEEKKPFLALQAVDKQRYDEEMKKYDPVVTTDKTKKIKTKATVKTTTKTTTKPTTQTSEKEEDDSSSDSSEDEEDEEEEDEEEKATKLFFSKHIASRLKKQNNRISDAEIESKANSLWQELSEERKQVFRAAVKKEDDSDENSDE